MSFWLIAALLTLAAALAVMFPFLRSPRRQAAGGAHDLEVYRDQLAELERDVARGVLGRPEADEARAEIGRRILQAGDGSGAAEAPRIRRGARLTAAAAVLAVPLVSWGLYGMIGSPGLPSEPLQARLAKDPQDSTLDELLARAEAHLARDPDDGRGWDVLAPVYFRLERYADARNAYENAIRLAGASAAREAGLGEAITAEQGGVVSADAEAAFARALELDPDSHKARFFLAMAKAQGGEAAGAETMWRAMLADLPADSPWRGAVEQALAQVEPARSEEPGPDAEEVTAASRMAPEDRMAMIEGMVARLDRRLREKPGDAQGWQRLVHSYLVLGRRDDAEAALRRGVEALGDGSEEAKRLQTFAASQGLETVR